MMAEIPFTTLNIPEIRHHIKGLKPDTLSVFTFTIGSLASGTYWEGWGTLLLYSAASYGEAISKIIGLENLEQYLFTSGFSHQIVEKYIEDLYSLKAAFLLRHLKKPSPESVIQKTYTTAHPFHRRVVEMIQREKSEDCRYYFEKLRQEGLAVANHFWREDFSYDRTVSFLEATATHLKRSRPNGKIFETLNQEFAYLKRITQQAVS